MERLPDRKHGIDVDKLQVQINQAAILFGPGVIVNVLTLSASVLLSQRVPTNLDCVYLSSLATITSCHEDKETWSIHQQPWRI
jgi:hypothetical protein